MSTRHCKLIPSFIALLVLGLVALVVGPSPALADDSKKSKPRPIEEVADKLPQGLEYADGVLTIDAEVYNVEETATGIKIGKKKPKKPKPSVEVGVTCKCSEGGGCNITLNGGTATCTAGGCSGTCGMVVVIVDSIPSDP